MKHALAFFALFSMVSVTAFAKETKLNRGLVSVLQHQCEAVTGWGWQLGDEMPSPNVGGVVANALLDAYGVKPDTATWVTLAQYANRLAEVHGQTEQLPYKGDIEFLARWARVANEPGHWVLAKQLFKKIREVSPTGQAEYDRIALGRAEIAEIIGYDVALSIRAALAVGEVEFARDLAAAVIAGKTLLVMEPNDSYAVTSAGAMLHALGILAEPEFEKVRGKLAVSLMAAQAKTGSWGFNNTQATAYAVMGLATIDLDTAAEAAHRGRGWLADHQLRAGAWASYHDGLPEPFVGPVLPLVEAEALSALVAGL